MTSSLTNPTSCDGPGLLAMFESALQLVEANVPELNRLNVFPVPDGDTGTNMYLTLRDVVANTAPVTQDSVSETSRAMAKAALMGGRGNSGVLLSHFFMGMADALEGCTECGGADFSRSLASASVQAYGGIGHPKEGTILTVMRESADAAGALEPDDLGTVLQRVCEAALDSVARTPTLLPVLARAGLVDAGGYGFYVILEGMRRHIQNVGDLDEMLVAPQPDMSDGNISAEFLEDIEEEEFGFCTQFLLTGEGTEQGLDHGPASRSRPVSRRYWYGRSDQDTCPHVQPGRSCRVRGNARRGIEREHPGTWMNSGAGTPPIAAPSSTRRPRPPWRSSRARVWNRS